MIKSTLKIAMSTTLLAVITLSACKKKEKSSDIADSVPYYQEYTATFDKSDNSTKATAFLRLNDKKGHRIEFTGGAYIHANNVNENDKQAGSENYNWAFQDVNSVKFEIKKNGGQMLTNTIELGDIGTISFGSMPSSFSRNAGFNFKWEGADLNGDELTITLAGRNNAGAEIIKTLTADKDKTIFVFSASISDLNTGNVIIKMERSKKLSLDASDNNAGGEMRVKTSISKTIYMSN